MELRFKKGKDAPTTLTFVRADGSHTSQQVGEHRGFGPVHDLSHYVVESVFGLRRAFLGLCAEGWTIEETGSRNRELPAEAFVGEVLAGHLSRMEMMRQWDSLDDFNWAIAEALKGAASVTATQEQYDAMFRAITELRGRWNRLAPGETLVLEFEPGARVRVDELGVMHRLATGLKEERVLP